MVNLLALPQHQHTSFLCPDVSDRIDGQAQDDPKSVYSTTIVVPFLDGITQAIQRVLRPLEIRGGWTSATVGLVAATEFKGQG